MSKLRPTTDRIDCANGIHLTVIDHSDSESLVKYLNDVDIHATTGSIPFPYTSKDAENFIKSVLTFEKENKIQRDWAVRIAEGEQIGGIGFLFNNGLSSHRSEIGYWIGKPFWNQGIMSNVVKTWTDAMLSMGPWIRLEALVFEANMASCKVLENAGFAREGLLRKVCKKGEAYRDAHLYAKLGKE